MEEQAQRRMSVDAFLAWDDGTDIRYERIDGVSVAMAPMSGRHAEMVVSLSPLVAGRRAAPACASRVATTSIWCRIWS